METKSIRRSVILLIVLLLAVDAKGCPCAKMKDSNDIVSDCQRKLTCLNDHKDECRFRYYEIVRNVLEETGCQSVSELCLLEVLIPTKFELETTGISPTLQKVQSVVDAKYPCIKDQEELNAKCVNEASAKRCLRKVHKRYECVNQGLKDCKTTGIWIF